MNLKPGTLCVIVGGCPGNIGLVVEVLAHLGKYGVRDDAYEVRTVSGRPLAQLWEGGGAGGRLTNAVKSSRCITDRHKLRPLVEPKDRARKRTAAAPKGKKRELETVD